MNATTTKVFQAIATLLQILNAVNVAQLPVKWQAAFTGLLTVAQAVQGVAAHYFTPAGNSINTAGQVTSSTGSVIASVPATKQ